MSDRATIELDCERGVVSVSLNTLHSVRIDRQIQTTRASLITELLGPVLKELMSTSTEGLKAGLKALRAQEAGQL